MLEPWSTSCPGFVDVLGPNTRPARLLQVAKTKTAAEQLFLFSNKIVRPLLFNYDLVMAV